MSLPITTSIPFASSRSASVRCGRGTLPTLPTLICLTGLTLGCASDGIDLGGGVLTQSLGIGERCQESTIVLEHVRITRQEELDELEGCEQIRGDLTVQMFPGADLTPLHALRIVEGGLALGDSLFNGRTEEQRADEDSVDDTVRAELALQGTWLTSLAGLESLERVSSLALMYTAVEDLSPLTQLREISGTGASVESAFQSNDLAIHGNPKLRDLRGLEQVRGVTELQLGLNGAMESLDGLQLGPELTLLALFDEPMLTDIDALAPVTRLGALSVNRVGLDNFDALSQLQTVEGAITVSNNPALADANGLGNVNRAESIEFFNNASLKTLPSFQSYNDPPKSIFIGDNPALEELIFDFLPSFTDGFFIDNEVFRVGLGGVVIRNNAALRSVAFPPREIEPIAVSAMQVVAFEANPSLVEVDFGALSHTNLLIIVRNPELAQVDLGELATVNALQIRDNPSLDASVFDPVRTFERIASGNAP